MTRAGERLAAHLIGYGASLAMLTVASVTQVLVVTAVLGLPVWTDLAVAQAAGLLAAAVTSLGLVAFGPSTVAPMDQRQAALFFLRSQVARAYVFAGTSVVVAATAYLLAEREPVASACTSVAVNMLALGGAWYFIGQRQVRAFVLRDTLPQVLGILGGLPVAAILGATAYSLILLLANGVVVALAFLSARSCADGVDMEWGPHVASSMVRRQSMPLASVCAGAVNSYGPLLVASHFVGGASAYAVMDRLVKYGLAAFGPGLQVLQGWVPEQGATLRARGQRALTVSAVAGAIFGGVAYLLTPFVGGLLGLMSQSTLLQIRLPMSIGLGLVVVGLVTSQVLLVPLGRQITILRSTSAGAVILIVAGPLMALSHGEPGVAWTSVCGEFVAVLWQVRSVLRDTQDGGRGTANALV